MKTTNRARLLTALLVCALAGIASAQTATTFTDTRDGQTYRKVKIGENNKQVWMAENLNYQTDGSRCYNDSAEYCEKYGRLYFWYEALKACPAGWHLPSDREWTALTKSVGGENIAGTKLKSKIGWYSGGKYYKPPTDDYGFSALPGGGSDGSFSYADSSGIFRYVGLSGLWWSATENYVDNIWRHFCYWSMSYDYQSVNKNEGGYYKTYLSVRCVRDN